MPLRARRRPEAVDTSRILSIGGDVTEILYALKADGKIIAVDSTSQFPAEALKQKPNVGYLRALSAEGVLSTNPTLDHRRRKMPGPPPVVAVLKASSIPYVEVPDDETPEGVAAKIRFVAAAVGARGSRRRAGQGRRARLRVARRATRQDHQARACLVRTERAERPRDGRRLEHERRRHAEAGRRRERRRRHARATSRWPTRPAVELAPDAIVTMMHGRAGPPSDAISTRQGAARAARRCRTTASSK